MQPDHTQQQSTEGLVHAQQMSMQRNQPPTQVPGIDVDRFLGSGAYGEVWVGLDNKTGRKVAIKFFSHRRAVDWSLLSREVGKLVFLSADRYVVQLLDVGWDADPPYYVMEYVEHGSLEDLINRQGTLSVEEAVDIFHEIVVGIVHSHGKGILHCDLKPANILLDQDNKPRLADFGQSRLSHEQAPALGTLFYMAPEQADLEAMPDAQWDVYALGAILYSMLTGKPPYRSEKSVSIIDTAATLSERLTHYRDVISSAPRLNLAAEVPGIDRSLVDIIQKCLARETRDRFANAQEVLEALRNRATARARRPMLILGIGGPIVLLLIMTLFGIRGYKQAVDNSQSEIRLRSFQGSHYAAKFVARTLENGFENYFRIVNSESSRTDLHQAVQAVLTSEAYGALQVDDTTENPSRAKFYRDSVRHKLRDYLKARISQYSGMTPAGEKSSREPKFASMFVTDKRGVIIAVAYDIERQSKSIGFDFSWRTYYHGQRKDLDKDAPRDVKPISSTSLSAAFASTTTKTWKVAVSTPVKSKDGELIGLIIATLNLGDFDFLDDQAGNQTLDRFAVLIDANPDQGQILQHPLFREAMKAGTSQNPTVDYTKSEFKLPTAMFDVVRNQTEFEYVDPMGRAPGGEQYRGLWLAVKEPVRLPNQNDNDDTHLAVIVQERFDAVTAPVRHLAISLVFEAVLALVGVVCAVFVLWYFVLYSQRNPNSRLNARPVTDSMIEPTITGDQTIGK